MASFLELCSRCTVTVRFASPHDVPDLVICDACEVALKDNEESAQREKQTRVRRTTTAAARRTKKPVLAKKR